MNDKVTTLLQQLTNGKPSEQSSVAEALQELGSPAVEPLIHILLHGKDEVRCRAAFVLGKLCDPRAIEPLISALAGESLSVFYYAATALIGYLPSWGLAEAMEEASDMFGDVPFLPHKVLSDTGLALKQKLVILDSLRRVQVPSSVFEEPYPLPDIPRFCQPLLDDEDRSVRTLAKQLLDKIKGCSLFPTEGAFVKRYYAAARRYAKR